MLFVHFVTLLWLYIYRNTICITILCAPFQRPRPVLVFQGEEDNSEEDSMPLPPVSPRKTPQRREHPVKERCKLLYRAIRDYVNDEGRQLSTVFTELPSRKLYPDYYEIIDSPIDLAKIESKIRSDQYDTESEILQDFKVGRFCYGY